MKMYINRCISKCRLRPCMHSVHAIALTALSSTPLNTLSIRAPITPQVTRCWCECQRVCARDVGVVTLGKGCGPCDAAVASTVITDMMCVYTRDVGVVISGKVCGPCDAAGASTVITDMM